MMTLDLFQLCVLGAAVIAILMLGTTHVNTKLWFYAFHTLLIAAAAGLIESGHRSGSMLVPLCFALFKGIGAPLFLSVITRRIKIQTDAGAFIPAPLCMHLNIFLLGLSYLIASELPGVVMGNTRIGATAAMSILFSGVLLMVTRRLAIGQIMGFLVMENGIYLFAVTQTHGMPMIVEMGVLLDVLVGVMIAGLLLFGIKRSFEHIDVSRLTELHD